MRPAILNPLFAPLTSLAGIGPKQDQLYRHLLGRGEAPARVFHLPSGTIDRRARPKLAEVTPGTVVTVAVKVDLHRPPPPRRSNAPYLIYASDDTGDIAITYFKARAEYLRKLFPVGALRIISGTAAIYDGMRQMVHPDRVLTEADLANLPLVDPVYPLTEGLGPHQLRRATQAALARVPLLPEWQEPNWL